ncbi:MAG TPA: Fe-S protein assembly co-chaperone HscB [Methylophilaceae bacterium]
MSSLMGTNYFELFGLTPKFTIDMNSLDHSFRRLQTEMHPDRYAAGTEAEKRMAMQLSSNLNDGYRALKHPSSRAQYLMSLAGKPEVGNAVSSAFLMAQMEWREAIEEARAGKNMSELTSLSRRLRQAIAEQEKILAVVIDEQSDFNLAAQRVSELRFYEKLRVEIDLALDALES